LNLVKFKSKSIFIIIIIIIILFYVEKFLKIILIIRFPFEDNQEITPIDWQQFIKEIAMGIISEQTPKKLQEVRGKLYELLVHCIPATDIIKVSHFILF